MSSSAVSLLAELQSLACLLKRQSVGQVGQVDPWLLAGQVGQADSWLVVGQVGQADPRLVVGQVRQTDPWFVSGRLLLKAGTW